MAGFTTQERDTRIAQGKGTMADKLPFIVCMISCVCSCLIVLYILATGGKNKAKSAAAGFAGTMGTMLSAM